jgi:hypothetical protein
MLLNLNVTSKKAFYKHKSLKNNELRYSSVLPALKKSNQSISRTLFTFKTSLSWLNILIITSFIADTDHSLIYNIFA